MKKINGSKTERRRNAMRNMLFVAALATAALATTFAPPAMAKSPCQRTCENTYAPDPKCPDSNCTTFASTLRGECIGNCKGEIPPPPPRTCSDGEKWCKITKSCVPIADFDTVCKGKTPDDWCASANDGKGGPIAKGTDCPSCFSIGMLDAPDKRSCLDPCSDEGVLIFSCMSWCPSLNDGHGGFIQASQYAACEACPFGDNGMRCNAKGEGDCPDCNGGGIDPTLLYVLIAMVGLGLILLIVLIVTKKDKDPKPPTSKPASPTKPTTTAPTPPLPRPSGSGPSAPTTAP